MRIELNFTEGELLELLRVMKYIGMHGVNENEIARLFYDTDIFRHVISAISHEIAIHDDIPFVPENL